MSTAARLAPEYDWRSDGPVVAAVRAIEWGDPALAAERIEAVASDACRPYAVARERLASIACRLEVETRGGGRHFNAALGRVRKHMAGVDRVLNGGAESYRPGTDR